MPTNGAKEILAHKKFTRFLYNGVSNQDEMDYSCSKHLVGMQSSMLLTL